MNYVLGFAAFLVFLLVAQRQALKRKPSVTPAQAEHAHVPVPGMVLEELKAKPVFDGPQIGEVWRLNQRSDPWPKKPIDAFILDRIGSWVRYSHNKEGLFPTACELDDFLRIFSRVSP